MATPAGVNALAREFAATASGADPDLGRATLLVARLEYPHLDPAPYLKRLDRMGHEVRRRLAERPGTLSDQFATLSTYLYEDQGFRGTRVHYEDPRNSCLNQVLDRRCGIPVTLAIVFLEVAKRAGVPAAGVGFPGHFLVRGRPEPTAPARLPLVIDPFDRGRPLSESDCRELLRRSSTDEAEFDLGLLAPSNPRQILLRVLGNLKRMYVQLRSFPQARNVTELLLALNPSGVSDLRDRGLLAYHMQDFSGALRDLEAYLRATARTGTEAARTTQEAGHEQIWEHIKTLRRRVASLN